MWPVRSQDSNLPIANYENSAKPRSHQLPSHKVFYRQSKTSLSIIIIIQERLVIICYSCAQNKSGEIMEEEQRGHDGELDRRLDSGRTASIISSSPSFWGWRQSQRSSSLFLSIIHRKKTFSLTRVRYSPTYSQLSYTSPVQHSVSSDDF